MIKPRFSRTIMPTHAGSGTDGCTKMTDWAQLLAVSCELESVWQTRAGDVQSTQAARIRCGAPAFAGYRISYLTTPLRRPGQRAARPRTRYTHRPAIIYALLICVRCRFDHGTTERLVF